MKISSFTHFSNGLKYKLASSWEALKSYIFPQWSQLEKIRIDFMGQDDNLPSGLISCVVANELLYPGPLFKKVRIRWSKDFS